MLYAIISGDWVSGVFERESDARQYLEEVPEAERSKHTVIELGGLHYPVYLIEDSAGFRFLMAEAALADIKGHTPTADDDDCCATLCRFDRDYRAMTAGEYTGEWINHEHIDNEKLSRVQRYGRDGLRLLSQAATFVLRNIAGHHWGWFDREEQRMHLEALSLGTSAGPKVWLEEHGRRVCQAAGGELDLQTLRQTVMVERRYVERRWIAYMIENGWLRAELSGRTITLTAYPSSPSNSFTRTIDLQAEFPGVYKGERAWDANPPEVDLDAEHAAIAVGHAANWDNREHIDLAKWVFVD